MTRDIGMAFIGCMIQALLRGDKDETRRLINPQPSPAVDGEGRPAQWTMAGLNYANDWRWHQRGKDWAATVSNRAGGPTGWVDDPKFPYHAGDRIWIRERAQVSVNVGGASGAVVYEADRGPIDFPALRFRAAHLMPRTWSRLTALIEAVRLEQLQAITRESAIREGIKEDDGSEPDIFYLPGSWKIKGIAQADDPRKVYASLWNSLNADRGWTWDANPWVCVLKLRIIKGNIDSETVRKELQS